MIRRAVLGTVVSALAIGLAGWFSASAHGDAQAPAAAGKTATAIFAGGCFWCMEPPFDRIDGVLSTTSGYTGGKTANPTYEEISNGGTGHYEAVRIVYDPAKVSYESLLEVFWRNVDPLDGTGQFCDKGPQYRAAIFPLDETQTAAAQASRKALEESKRWREPVMTEILPAARFYPAEEYHQDYYQKNPIRYKFYRTGCGRDRRLADLWG